MSRRKKKGCKNDLTALEIIILTTTILQLIQAAIELITALVE